MREPLHVILSAMDAFYDAAEREEPLSAAHLKLLQSAASLAKDAAPYLVLKVTADTGDDFSEELERLKKIIENLPGATKDEVISRLAKL